MPVGSHYHFCTKGLAEQRRTQSNVLERMRGRTKANAGGNTGGAIRRADVAGAARLSFTPAVCSMFAWLHMRGGPDIYKRGRASLLHQ